MKYILPVVVFASCSYVVLSQTTQAPPPPSGDEFTCFTCKSGPCLDDSEEEFPTPSTIWVEERCGPGITQCLSRYSMEESSKAISRSCATANVAITDAFLCTTDEKTKIVTCFCDTKNCNNVNPHNAHNLPLGDIHGTPGRSDHGGHNSAGMKDQWLVLVTGLISLLLCRFLNNFRG